MELKKEVYVQVNYVGEIKLLNYFINKCDDKLCLIIDDKTRIVIANEIGTSVNSVSRYLKALCELKIITKIMRGMYKLNTEYLRDE